MGVDGGEVKRLLDTLNCQERSAVSEVAADTLSTLGSRLAPAVRSSLTPGAGAGEEALTEWAAPTRGRASSATTTAPAPRRERCRPETFASHDEPRSPPNPTA